MQEFVFVTLWLTASAFSAIQLFFHRGGVLATIAALIMWIPIYFGSTAVETVSSGVVIEVANPMVQWFAVLMIILEFVILLFVLAGVGPWSDRQPEDEGLATAADQLQNRF